jgi:asparagine synthase (glutamine-hydrolysing)
VALMQAQSSRPVKTFTIGFYEDRYNEATHAQKVAAHLGTEHTELFVTAKDALEVVPLLPAMYDEPFSDSSQIPTYLVSRLARSRVTVSLSGDGGDELFHGYNRYLQAQSIWNVAKRLPPALRRSAARMLRAVPGYAVDRSLQVLRPLIANKAQLYQSGNKAHSLASYLSAATREKIYLRALSHWDDPSSLVLHSHEPSTVLDSLSPPRGVEGFAESMMLADLLHYLPDDILTKVDRASMAVSLEARVPLLDHRVVEFAWRLPLRFKIRHGVSKWILRQVLYKYVPRELIERPKMGFGVPVESWLRGPLREWAEDLLSESRLRRHGFFEVEPIRSKWKQHLSGARNWQYLLWDVLVFQDWHAKMSQLARNPQPSAAAALGGN